MVGSIRPVVYRDHRILRWAIALLLHLLASVFAAAVVGTVFGVAGELIVPRIGGRELWMPSIVAPISLLYALTEVELIRMPRPQLTRQVPQLWRSLFHPYATAVLYGLELGTGITTRIITGAFYVLVLGIVVWGNATYAILTFSIFGLARAAMIWVIGWHLRSMYTGEEVQPVMDRIMDHKEHVHLLNASVLALIGGYWLGGLTSLLR